MPVGVRPEQRRFASQPLEGEDQRQKYPDGADPYVLGESTNTAQTYGYDSVTQMQETKATLCKIYAA